MTKLSRSKIEMYIQCPRCFWMDQVAGIKRPSMPAFTLNSAVDHLLKQEFDIHRVNGDRHPLQEQYGIDARPAAHAKLDAWRHNFTGVQYHHKPTDLLLFGAIDDLWINSHDEYIVVDYKATAKNGAVDRLEDTPWHDAYKRQMEVYQWLLRQNGYKVSSTGYFVYANGQKDRKAFDGKLEFEVKLITYTGDDSWVEGKIMEIYNCLNNKTCPESTKGCEYCDYIKAVKNIM